MDMINNAPDVVETIDSFLASGLFWGFLGAVLTVIFSFIGAARGIGIAGEAVSGLTSENPSLFGKAFIVQSIPVTQALFGLITAFVTCLKLGLFSEQLAEINLEQGALIFLSCLPIGIVGLFSAIFQGRTAASAICILAKNPPEVKKCVFITIAVEICTVLSFLVSLLLVNYIIK